MNRIRCSFCGKEHESEAFSVVCSCGYKARSLFQTCATCGKQFWSTVKRSKCLPCLKSEGKTLIWYQCKNGHEFKAAEKWRAKCPQCSEETSRRQKVCACGVYFFATVKADKCSICSDVQKRTLREKAFSESRPLSEDQQRATELCAKAPAAVHSFIWAEIYRHPHVAERIAKQAKTAAQAQEIINEVNMSYFRQKSSYGVASYG